jgi:hypothetical protein
MGSLYKRGNIWWIKYYRGSAMFRESAHTDNEKSARKLLDLRQAQVKTGTLPPRSLERVTFEELAEDFLNNYRVNGKKSLPSAEIHIKRLKEFFAGYLVKNLSTSAIKDYILIRQNQGKKNGTINRQLAALKRMLTLAARHEPRRWLRCLIFPCSLTGVASLSMKIIWCCSGLRRIG